MMRYEGIRRYRRDLGMLCFEVADQPKLVPLFLQVLLLVPRAIAELAKSPLRVAKKAITSLQRRSDHAGDT